MDHAKVFPENQSKKLPLEMAKIMQQIVRKTRAKPPEYRL